jgi:hypothetical protein
MQKLLEITNSQNPGHFYKFKKPAPTAVFGSKRQHIWGKEAVL